jgi:acyl transferase domain-containing protein
MEFTAVTPVAVTGMACRLPGRIGSSERLWEALLRGDDLVIEIPRDRDGCVGADAASQCGLRRSPHSRAR